jgi:carbamoyl-phosphate synthase large subunit
VYRVPQHCIKSNGLSIAKIASKLALGYNLDELQTKLQINFGFIRTDIDYVIVKIPRWNFDKFEGADRTLGLQMKSVGEVMELDVRSKSCTKRLNHEIKEMG